VGAFVKALCAVGFNSGNGRSGPLERRDVRRMILHPELEWSVVPENETLVK
jgi:hypothetical protein